MTATLLLGTGVDEVRALAGAVGADLVEVPDLGDGGDGSWPWADGLEGWRRGAAAGPPCPRVVVAVWSPAEDLAPGVLGDVDLAAWVDRAERPLAAWAAALGAAATRCADGGAVVAVVEQPPSLDCAGWAPELAVSDAVEALTRSLARSEGPRGVRVNAVTTPARLVHGHVVAPPPPLASFPGTVEREVAGAVRLLLDADAAGLTGTVVHADSGRSWR